MPSLCDCELAHNGLGMAIRECDCEETKAEMSNPETTHRKAPVRHPSTEISKGVIEEIAYRVYLLRLQPAMTPERAAVYRYVDGRTGRVTDGESLRRQSDSYCGLTRDYLRVLVDMGLVVV